MKDTRETTKSIKVFKEIYRVYIFFIDIFIDTNDGD